MIDIFERQLLQSCTSNCSCSIKRIFIHITFRKNYIPFLYSVCDRTECQVVTSSQKTSKPSETTMPTVTAYTGSHEKTSSAYKSMSSATTTSTPSTVVDNLHAAPHMSSISRHHALIGSDINVGNDREREVSVRAASSSAGTSVRSARSNRIRPTGTRDGSVRSYRTHASTTLRSSRLSRTSGARHNVSGGARRSVSSRSQRSLRSSSSTITPTIPPKEIYITNFKMMTITRDVQIPRDLFIPLQPAHRHPSQPNTITIIATS